MEIMGPRKASSRKPVTKEGHRPRPDKYQSSVQSPPPRTYTVDLPSKGLLYNGKSSVEVSLLTVKDAKRIFDISRGTKTDSIQKLITEKVIDFDAEELSKQDVWYLTYWIRLNSYPNHPIVHAWVCDKEYKGEICNTKNTSTVTSKELIIKELDSNYSEPVELKLPDYGTVLVRLPRYKDSEASTKLLKSLYNDKWTDGDFWQCIIASMIVDDSSLMDRYNLVRKTFTPDDLFMIDAFENEFLFGVMNYVNLKCSGCQEVSQVRFRISLPDFLPSMHTGSNIRNAIRFSKASEPAASNE